MRCWPESVAFSNAELDHISSIKVVENDPKHNVPPIAVRYRDTHPVPHLGQQYTLVLLTSLHSLAIVYQRPLVEIGLNLVALPFVVHCHNTDTRHDVTNLRVGCHSEVSVD